MELAEKIIVFVADNKLVGLIQLHVETYNLGLNHSFKAVMACRPHTGEGQREFDLAMLFEAFGLSLMEYEAEVGGWQSDDDCYEMSDVEADADALAGIGWGTDEDYGCFGCEDY